MSEEKLKAKVRAVNRANREANRLYTALTEALTPFVGCKIIRADGELMKEVAKNFPDFGTKNDFDLMVYKNRSEYSLSFTVKAGESIDGTSKCLYHETTVYIGSLSNGVLINLSSAEQYREDYNFEDVKAKRRVYDLAKKTLDAALSAIGPFGASDSSYD